MNCPNCEGPLDVHFDTSSGYAFKPEPGDVAVCWHCGSRNIIDDKGRLVMLSPDSEKNLSDMEKARLQRTWERWNAKNSIRGN